MTAPNSAGAQVSTPDSIADTVRRRAALVRDLTAMGGCPQDKGVDLSAARAAANFAVAVITRVRTGGPVGPGERDELAILGRAFSSEAQRLLSGELPADTETASHHCARMLIANSAEREGETAIGNAACLGTVLTEIAERGIWAVHRQDVEQALSFLLEWADDVNRRLASDS